MIELDSLLGIVYAYEQEVSSDHLFHLLIDLVVLTINGTHGKYDQYWL